MKYRPDFPQRFGAQDHAHTWARAFFSWYHQEYHHIALGLLMRAMVHFGQATEMLAQRQATLATAYARQEPPGRERFVQGPPVPPVLPTLVWINPPSNPNKLAGNGSPDSLATLLPPKRLAAYLLESIV